MANQRSLAQGRLYLGPWSPEGLKREFGTAASWMGKITLLFCHDFAYTILYHDFYMFQRLFFCIIGYSFQYQKTPCEEAPQAHKKDPEAQEIGQATGSWVRAERRPWEATECGHCDMLCWWPCLGE